MCLEIGSKPEEATPYCQKAVSVCKSRVQRLTNEVKSVSESTTSSTASELDQGVNTNVSESDNSVTEKGAEIETLIGLCGELEKKVSFSLCKNLKICICNFIPSSSSILCFAA